jgi:hypothetical protein
MWDCIYTLLSRKCLLCGAGVHLENTGPSKYNVFMAENVYETKGASVNTTAFFTVYCVSPTYFF